MGLITETNEQYYVGTQSRISVTGTNDYTFTFNEMLSLGSTTSWDPLDPDYVLNNFIVETSPNGLDPYTLYDGINNSISTGSGSGGSFAISSISESTPSSTLTFTPSTTGSDAIQAGYYIRVTLKNPNHGDYAYVSLNDIVNNFLIGYVGKDKLILSAKRTDIIFHAKRGLQEFSYDTLKSMKSQELTIPPSLSVIIPQDYVNYVKCSWIDGVGVKHIIYPTTLTSNPMEKPIQDDNGVPIQDHHGQNIQGTSITEEDWEKMNTLNLSGELDSFNANIYDWTWWKTAYGRRYGLDPSISQSNGWFTINEREGKFSFSSDLAGKLIILDYISDGLSYDGDTKIPKMAEEALYMHIAYSILAGRRNVPEYVVQRFKKDRRAALRNAKIRLSNMKLGEMTQIMRGKSKFIKN